MLRPYAAGSVSGTLATLAIRAVQDLWDSGAASSGAAPVYLPEPGEAPEVVCFEGSSELLGELLHRHWELLVAPLLAIGSLVAGACAGFAVAGFRWGHRLATAWLQHDRGPAEVATRALDRGARRLAGYTSQSIV